jgi:hypothetical protein
VSDDSKPMLLKVEDTSGKLNTEVDALRQQLVDMERQLIGLLTTVQRVLGKEPSVLTRKERRRE